jgi:lipopolysaccharide heptosyltransferase I
VSAIRRAHPDAEIDWMVDVVHRDLLDLVPILTNVITLNRPTTAGWMEARAALRARDYAVALDFQGLIKSAALTWMSGARRCIGFDRAALREPMAASFYSQQVVVDDSRHVIHKNLQLASVVGVETATLEFPLAEVASAALDELRQRSSGSFVLLNCGAAWPNKRWPAERFGRVARWLKDTHDLASVALWGPGERPLAEEVARVSGGAAVAAPETNLRDLVALSRAARLMVSGDTGPTHIASAVGTPVVALFGPTNPARNGPWASDDVVISRYDSCDCHYQRQCRREIAGWCLASITEDDVCRAIDRRLSA